MSRVVTGPSYRKIMVVSDTHGDFASLKRAYVQCGPDLIVHLGDGVEELLRLTRLFPVAIEAVNGNGDPRDAFPEETVLEIAGVRLLLLHRHQGEDILRRAKNAKARWVLQGHTHRPEQRKAHGIHWLNPGSLCFHLAGGRPGFIVLTVEKKNIIAEFCRLEGGEVAWSKMD